MHISIIWLLWWRQKRKYESLIRKVEFQVKQEIVCRVKSTKLSVLFFFFNINLKHSFSFNQYGKLNQFTFHHSLDSIYKSSKILQSTPAVCRYSSSSSSLWKATLFSSLSTLSSLFSKKAIPLLSLSKAKIWLISFQEILTKTVKTWERLKNKLCCVMKQ